MNDTASVACRCAIVVRPDGYVGIIAALDDYFAGLMLSSITCNAVT
jgi:hypothetical protein